MHNFHRSIIPYQVGVFQKFDIIYFNGFEVDVQYN